MTHLRLVETKRSNGFREPEEILAQMEARLEEMRVEAAKPENMFPCEQCKWQYHSFCQNPLVIGLKEGPKWNWDRKPSYVHREPDAALCGSEKVLWQPTLWTRIKDWIALLFAAKEPTNA